ncbi:MAG: DUF3267 domain-containing protein [Clostridia bacterium]|nr:DUF3267 domain-containing protein [Clostridia bacterium]
MKKQLIYVDLKKVNFLSIISFIIPLAIGGVLKFTLFNQIKYGLGFWDYLIVFALCPILFALHEGVHAIAFLIGGAPKTSIRFGAIPKKMILYCTTSEPIKPVAYKISLLAPLVVLGIIPYIISTIILSFPYLILFSIMISGAAGDVMMLYRLTGLKKVKLILDHPKAPAFYALYDEGDLPENFVEYVETDEEKVNAQIN